MILIGPFGGRFFLGSRLRARGGAPLRLPQARDRIGCGGRKTVKPVGESDRLFKGLYWMNGHADATAAARR
jgi:hypothetical protein